MHRTHRLLIVLAAVPAVLRAQQSPQVTRTVRGDTTIVRSTGPGLWGAPQTPREVLRIGDENPDVTFGLIMSVVALRNGNVAVFDQKGVNGPVIMLFDSTGQFIRNVGRQGAGPGEYGSEGRLAASPDGSFYLWDPRLSRIDHYAADGKALRALPFQSGLWGLDMLRTDAHGGVYLLILAGAVPHDGSDWPMGYQHYDSTGAIRDTIRPPAFDDADAAEDFNVPRDFWTILPTGQVVSGTDNRMAVLIHGPGSRVLRIERAVPVVRYDPKERAERLAVARYEVGMNAPGTYVGKPPAIPEVKPMIRGVVPDLDGRVWVQRSVAGVPVKPHPAFGPLPPGVNRPAQPVPTLSFTEPVVYDVFRLDGTYLGEAQFRPEVHIQAFGRDAVWATTTDADDVPVLVKYRIETQGGH
jgi:6-bladed beta-propeller